MAIQSQIHRETTNLVKITDSSGGFPGSWSWYGGTLTELAEVMKARKPSFRAVAVDQSTARFFLRQTRYKIQSILVHRKFSKDLMTKLSLSPG